MLVRGNICEYPTVRQKHWSIAILHVYCDLSFGYSHLTQHNPTDFVAPHRLGLFASLTVPRNPNLIFHNGFKILWPVFYPIPQNL